MREMFNDGGRRVLGMKCRGTTFKLWLSVLLLVVSLATCRPSADGHQKDKVNVTDNTQSFNSGQEEDLQPNVPIFDEEYSTGNNKSASDLKQMVQAMINRPVVFKNSTLSAFGGPLFNTCVHSCSTLKESVTDLHSCLRECLNDPYKYRGPAEKSQTT